MLAFCVYVYTHSTDSLTDPIHTHSQNTTDEAALLSEVGQVLSQLRARRLEKERERVQQGQQMEAEVRVGLGCGGCG